MKKRALFSVYDKTGCAPFAKFLKTHDYNIISTGGTYRFLQENGIDVTNVSEITQFPEILDGRVKTLHPNILGGILAKRDMPAHMDTLQAQAIEPIDMVIVNLYPFFENAQENLDITELVEFIDIGGPTMLRSAAKSFFDLTVICSPDDYLLVQQELVETGKTHLSTRKRLASKVFNLTSAYDAAIATSLSDDLFPLYLNAAYHKAFDLRYGENPHQQAAFYTEIIGEGILKDMDQLGGKELSFNNIRDMDMAYKVVCEFDEIACCAVKHSTLCGVSIGQSVQEAYQKTYACDPISIFGGIVAFNQSVDAATADLLIQTFLEIIIAPSFTEDALGILRAKKNLRLIQTHHKPTSPLEYVKVDGGLLVQQTDNRFSTQLNTVTKAQPSESQLKDLTFAQKIVKHVKSNAIVVASNQQALGIGTGETNRIWAAEQAISRAKQKKSTDLVMASDAFFPFRDVVDLTIKNGIQAIIQPGGSIRDQESIDACNEHDVPMIFTGLRHFKH